MIALPLLAALASPAAAPDFDREVAPLLVRRCLDCHSGTAPKGRLDLSRHKGALRVVTPGKPNDSEFWLKVRDDAMPPKKPLTAAEKELLRRWIAAGARWGGDPIDPYRASTASRAGYDWWSLQPVRRPPLPAVHDAGWPRSPIDRFILARLEAARLAPSPEADRRTLIRRLSFDLIGLPPTPAEVDAFRADDRPGAYERVVERLLTSPHYGERWGRHWLDVARYGESDGFERDLPRTEAWPYRDWVVTALNADLPYDEFARLQLAGDVLRPGDADALAATGFLVAGPHDIVLPVSETMKASMRQEELEDVVGTVGQAFLGLTVHCARCHDHKFDPVPQRDYYRLAAALAGVRFGLRPAAREQERRQLAQAQARLAGLRRDIDAIEEPVRRLIRAERSGAKGPHGPRPLLEWDFTAEPAVRLFGAARLDGGLRLDGRTAYATAPLRVDLTQKTLEAWVRLDNLTQRGGGVLGVQTLDGRTFDAIVFGEQQPGMWLVGSDFFRRTKPLQGPAEKEATKRIVHVAVTYAADGTVTFYRDGRPHGAAYRADGVQRFAAGQAQVVFGLRHGPPGGNRLLAGLIVRARLHNRALSADEVARSAGLPIVRAEEIVPRLRAADRDRRARLLADADRLGGDVRRLEQLAKRKIHAVVSGQPGLTHLLARGSVTSKGAVVAPEVPAALARLRPTGLKPDAPEGDRRRALATWISDPNNPLFARVVVNRLWLHHFGAGLVETPSDFGFNGGRPSHPELLDWLAGELVRSGWSLKHVHRLIVTSAAYRQASRHRPEAARLDANNRLLWRRSPARLEAEAVRDAMLAVSGRLDRTIGGPPYLDFRSYFFKGTQFYDPLEQVGPPFERRSLYRMWARGGRSPFLDTFDCPDPSITTPRRAVTTTPLQALALFNNAMVLHLAEEFAARVRREAGGDVDAQVRLAWRLAYGREPDGRERALVRAFVERHGLAALGRVVFNSNEFVQAE